MYKTLLVDERDRILHVTLNRPEVHNAFNEELIGELIDVIDRLGERNVRAVVLRGSGANFCAGADLHWMSRMVGFSREENIRDAAQMAKMFATLNSCPLPLIGRVHGAALGGGVGLAAVCDIVIAAADAKFGLTEVKLGILPAIISPYTLAKIGETHARALFLTGERFDAQRALRIGLVHRVVENADALDAAVDETTAQIKTSGPEAVREAKKLIARVAVSAIEDAVPYTIETIATRRVSDEGQAAMKAFLKKEKPPWV